MERDTERLLMEYMLATTQILMRLSQQMSLLTEEEINHLEFIQQEARRRLFGEEGEAAAKRGPGVGGA